MFLVSNDTADVPLMQGYHIIRPVLSAKYYQNIFHEYRSMHCCSRYIMFIRNIIFLVIGEFR